MTRSRAPAAVSAKTLGDLDEAGKEQQRNEYAAALEINLVLNAGWSFTFFTAHRPKLAPAVAAALAASSIDLTRRAAKVSSERGVALAPYAAWTSFATALTAQIARRNRSLSARLRS